MPRHARHQRILAHLERHGELTVEEGCGLFEASPATLRRDFAALVAEGEALKTWGGIKANPTGGRSTGMLPFAYREGLRSEEKARIAAAAAALVQDGEVVLIDGGTTTFHLARHLAQRRVTVVTNSLVVAYHLDRLRRGSGGAEIITTGGIVHPESGLLIGPQVAATLREYHAQWAFLSVLGIDAEGASNSDAWTVAGEQAMIEHAARVAVLADSSKLGHRGPCRLCGLETLDVLVSDAAPAPELTQALMAATVELRQA